MWLCFSESLAGGLHWAVQRATRRPRPHTPFPQLPAAEALICPIFSSSCGEMVWCHICRLLRVRGTAGFCYLCFLSLCCFAVSDAACISTKLSAYLSYSSKTWPSDFLHWEFWQCVSAGRFQQPVNGIIKHLYMMIAFKMLLLLYSAITAPIISLMYLLNHCHVQFFFSLETKTIETFFCFFFCLVTGGLKCWIATFCFAPCPSECGPLLF